MAAERAAAAHFRARDDAWLARREEKRSAAKEPWARRHEKTVGAEAAAAKQALEGLRAQLKTPLKGA